MPALLIRGVFIAGLLSISLAGPIAAQALRGRLSSRETGKAIPGAVVQLLDGAAQVRSRTLSDAYGGFSLTAPSAGRYRLRVERIGFASENSDWIDLPAGQVVNHAMVISSSSISLEGITVRSRSRGCSIQESGETVARVWEEARKALDAIALSQSASLVYFDAETFRRELDPQTRAVRTEQRRSSFDHADNPFRSVPVEELAERGYVRAFPDSTLYYAPDASVLLSEPFLDTHCFQITSGRSGDADLLGLAFRPRGRVTRPDIEGTLWVDPKTSELRSVDYGYIGHQLDVPADRLGGRIEFERVASSGAWIVRRWVIRMPVLTQRKTRFTNPATNAPEERVETIIEALVEEGGEVVAVSTSGPGRSTAGRARVSGTVMDSVSGKPLRDAIVYLSGTSFADTTDASGQFGIAGVTSGSYVVSFMHPTLRALGIVPSSRRIEVSPPSEARIDLAVASIGTLLQQHCPAMKAEDGVGVLVGHVTDARTGDPVARAQVRVEWTAESSLRAGTMPRGVDPSGRVSASVEDAWVKSTRASTEVSTDQTGFFRVCGLPLQSQLDVRVQAGGSSTERSMRTGRDPLFVQDLTVGNRQ